MILFCGANQTKVPFEIAATLQKLGNRAEYVKIAGTGLNALDFHIAYYIGKLAAADPSAYFHIVSKDKGFDPLIQHLKTQKVFASRSASIAEIPIVKNGNLKLPVDRAEAFIARFKDPKITKPRTEKTMCSAIKAHFRPQVDDPEATEVLKKMVAKGFIRVEAGKIIYAE